MQLGGGGCSLVAFFSLAQLTYVICHKDKHLSRCNLYAVRLFDSLCFLFAASTVVGACVL